MNCDRVEFIKCVYVKQINCKRATTLSCIYSPNDALTRFIQKPTFAVAGAVHANGLQVFHAAPGAWPPHGYQARSGLEEDKCRCSPNYARLVACWWHSIEWNGYNQRRQIHPPKKLTSHTHFCNCTLNGRIHLVIKRCCCLTVVLQEPAYIVRIRM